MYDHDDIEKIEYIEENVLCEDDGSDEFKILADLFNSTLINPCECEESACKNCHSGGNYTRDPISNELVLRRGIQTRPILECYEGCSCDLQKCLNRLVQFGPRKNLLVEYSRRFKSKGVITSSLIPKGAFICEYAGELLTKQIAINRQKSVDSTNSMNYILQLNEKGENSEETYASTIIDPTFRGNIARYINHSCDPNCGLYSVRVDCPVPKVGIFALCEIPSGKELTFDYGNINCKKTISKKLCLCGTKNCSLYLPHLDLS